MYSQFDPQTDTTFVDFIAAVNKRAAIHGENSHIFIAHFLESVIGANMLRNESLRKDIAWRTEYMNKEIA